MGQDRLGTGVAQNARGTRTEEAEEAASAGLGGRVTGGRARRGEETRQGAGGDGAHPGALGGTVTGPRTREGGRGDLLGGVAAGGP